MLCQRHTLTLEYGSDDLETIWLGQLEYITSALYDKICIVSVCLQFFTKGHK